MVTAGTDKPGAGLKEERRQVGEGSGECVVYNPNVAVSIEQQRQRLPVFKVMKQTVVDQVARI